MCSLLNNEPLLNEPGVTKQHKDYKNYNEIIKYKNIDVAINCMINKKTTYHAKFDMFYDTIKDNFKNNYNDILKLISDKDISNDTHMINKR